MTYREVIMLILSVALDNINDRHSGNIGNVMTLMMEKMAMTMMTYEED